MQDRGRPQSNINKKAQLQGQRQQGQREGQRQQGQHQSQRQKGQRRGPRHLLEEDALRQRDGGDA